MLQKVKWIALFSALTLGANLLPAGANVIPTAAADKISPALQTAMNEAASGEKVPVYIWTEDVNHADVEQQVQASTQLSMSAIQIQQPKPEIDLASVSDPIEFEQKMGLCVAQTETVREQKRAMTDAEVEARREAYVSEYSAQNTKSLRRLNVQDEDILFQSQYSPMVVVNMSRDEIARASQNSAVTSMGLCETRTVMSESIDSCMETVEADLTVTSLTGYGVKIGQIEPGVPNASDTALGGKVTILSGSTDYDHATNVAKFLHAVAPDVQIYAIGTGGTTTLSSFCTKVESLLNQGVRVINMSAGIERSSSNADFWYSPYEQWVDHISGTHEVTFVKSAGNNKPDLNVTEPGLANNVITVGAIDDRETGGNLTDDCFYHLTCSGNGGDDGCAKPDLVAPGRYASNDIGTSYAAPIVAGLAAQMMEYDPTLKNRARAVKAILLACCDRKVIDLNGDVQETMDEGITAMQGAGVVNAMHMCTILVQQSYISGNFTGSSYMTEIGLSGVTNVAATWLRENGVSNHTSGNVTVSPYQNCDLYLYSPSGVQYDSRLNMSSTEMIYRDNLPNGVYDVQLHKRDGNTTRTIWFGIAWY